ncbi:MAG: PEP-CTERM sorting domain-containing protein [Myxococcota bacterium]
MTQRRTLALSMTLLLLAALPAASTTTITFSGTAHGEVVDTDFAGQGLASIVVTNIGGGPNLGITFDTTETGTMDPDLEDPWSGGNLPSNTLLGNILVIQENATGCGDDVCDVPDDEGTRPAGSIELIFSQPVTTFGFDLIDVEGTSGPDDENGSIVFHDGLSTFTITWDDFESGGAFEVAGLVFGNNHINRIPEISPGDVGLTKFDKVVINMGGSGGIDNLIIPEPATALLVALGCAGFAVARRRA